MWSSGERLFATRVGSFYGRSVKEGSGIMVCSCEGKGCGIR
jgi:hypothetical protein